MPASSRDGAGAMCLLFFYGTYVVRYGLISPMRLARTGLLLDGRICECDKTMRTNRLSRFWMLHPYEQTCDLIRLPDHNGILPDCTRGDCKGSPMYGVSCKS